MGTYRASLLAGLCMVAALGLPAAEIRTSLAQETGKRPNILLIMTDDQDVESIGNMPKLQELLVSKGATFTQAFATTPQCCPSRASLLRGQYAHNHGVMMNWSHALQDEGWEKFVALGREESTVATWLKEAAYSTGYLGKYLNGYGNESLTTHVPPGWDTWRGWQGNYGQYGGESRRLYKVNEDGVIKTYDGLTLHDTHYLAREAETFIDAFNGRPWFLWVSPNPPHTPAFAAEEHKGFFQDSQMPKPASFNEADVSDKPAWISARALLDDEGIAGVEERWRQRQRSLQAVDDLIARVVSKLEETGQLDNTYIIFISDNGFLQYRHRVPSKGAPYEEAIRLPFVVRGPEVPEGVEREQLITNTDLAPTIADWAHIRPPDFVDGRSFAPQLSSNLFRWREQVLIEFYHSHPFQGVRTSDGKTYVEYVNGDRELYDLKADPYQLDSLHASPVHQDLMNDLRRRLAALRDCSGVACRAAEGGTPPAAPTGLTATPSSASIALDWDDRVGDDLVGLVGYNVYHADTEEGLFTRLNGEPLIISNYDDAQAPVGRLSHYLVTAVDMAGDESAPAAISATRPDITPPQTLIDSGPGRLTRDPTPSFSFSATDDASSSAELVYSYRVDQGQWSAYSSDTKATIAEEALLADGVHTFEVKAKDAAGNEDQSPAQRTFTVDTKGPAVKSVMPAADGRDIDPATNVEVFFSEAVRAASVSTITIKLFEKGSSVPLAVEVSYEASTKRAIVDPSSELLAGKSYRAVVNIGVRDVAGNQLDQDPSVTGNQRKVWFFAVSN